MKKIFLFLLLILTGSAVYCQSLSVFDVDTSSFPVMKAKFYAFDANWNQVLNLSPSDFQITENGQPRQVLSVSCPTPILPVALSSVLVMDQSGSMGEDFKLQSIHEAAKAWIEALPGKSECAITSFDDRNYIIQDFTTNKDLLEQKASTITANGGTDYNKAFIDPMAGGILIAQNGKYKKVIVLLSDGQPNFEPKTQEIIQQANANNITIYFVSLGYPSPQCMKDITSQTGGQYFENVTTVDEAKVVYLSILYMAESNDPCEIEWQSVVTCQAGLVNVEIAWNGVKSDFKYNPSSLSIASLSFNPAGVYFKNKPLGIEADSTITVTAINADFNSVNISSTNPEFAITPTNFNLKKGDSIKLTVSYTPTDSSYSYGRFEIQTDLCNNYFYVSGGFRGVNITKRTLKVTFPNGGEQFLAGSDTVITWEGVLPSDTVGLEYSSDNGNTWNLITNSATGLKYLWKGLPKKVSNECLIRIKQLNKSEIFSEFVNTIVCPLYVYCVSWSPDGNRFASGSNDHTIKIWDANNDILIKTLTGHTDWVNSVSWSPDGSKIVSGSLDSTIKLWDANSGSLIRTLTGHSNSVHSVCWSPEINKIASGSLDNTIKIWDANSGNLIRTLTGHNNYVMSVSWSPDGSKIASGSFDNTIKIWNANTGSLIITLTGQGENINCISWSPDGSKIASGNNDETIKLWDTNSGSLIKTLTGHNDYVMCLSWSPDGNRIVSGSEDKTIKIWDISNGFSQQDVSDSLWAIVKPQAASKDIDMKQCLIGSIKDSVITEFITNTGSYPCRIDTIYFTSGDASQFNLISRFFPFDVPVGRTKSVEIAFQPISVGIKNANIVIVTQANTLNENITGEGVQPVLSVLSNIIDFGKVVITDKKDSLALVLENVSSSSIRIISTIISGHDLEQFAFLDNGSFTIQPGQKKQLNLRFQPKYIGRTTTDLVFNYLGAVKPEKTQLYGEGIGGGLVYIDNDSAYVGDVKNIKLKLSGFEMDKAQSIASEFTTTLAFNSTLLCPIDNSLPKFIANDTTFLTIRQPLNAGDYLADFNIKAGLGNAAQTDIDIVNFNWLDASGNILDYDTQTQSGTFKILGICHEGGTRLINPNTKAGIINIAPNPANDEVNLTFSLIEQGMTDISIYNMLGEKVMTALSEYISNPDIRSMTVSTSTLGNGTYTIIFRTPTIVESYRLMVIK